MNIYASHVLDSYWQEEGEFRPAFLRWADAILERHDAAKARIRPQNNDGWRDNLAPAVRAAIVESHGKGITIRMLAERYSVTIRHVVVAIRPGSSGKADNYVALEEELLACGAPSGPQSWANLNIKH